MESSHPETVFGLIRHARTEWNILKKIQGKKDSPLAEEGRAQARTWGPKLAELSFDLILASSLGRARTTADLINQTLGLPIYEDSRLQEQDWGRWTGKILMDIERTNPEELAAVEGAGWRFRPPGGEDRLAVLERSMAALKEAGAQWPGQRILVVTHEGVIKCLLYHMVGRGFFGWEPKLLKREKLHLVTLSQNELRPEAINSFSLDCE